MGDLLSSASLLVAIVTVLYGHWYPDILLGINTKVPDYRESVDTPLSTVISIILRRALPLLLSSVGLTIVFLKDTGRILYISAKRLDWNILKRFIEYDAVSTAFVLVEVLWIYVSAQLISDFVKLIRKRRSLITRPSITDPT